LAFSSGCGPHVERQRSTQSFHCAGNKCAQGEGGAEVNGAEVNGAEVNGAEFTALVAMIRPPYDEISIEL
jgi:hypothetical protein